MLNFRKLGLVLNDIGLQGAVPNVLDCVADEVHHWKLGFQHTHGLIGEYVDGLHPRVWRCVQLAPVVRAICGESSYNVQVIGHVDLDVPGRHGAAELVGDGEGYCSIPLVDLKVLRYEEWHMLPMLLPLHGVVAGQLRDAIARSSCSSCLTLLASSSYLHPLGRVGRWYCIGIFVVLLDGRGQLIDQRDGVFTCEAKSCQLGSEWGSLSTRSDRSSRGLIVG